MVTWVLTWAFSQGPIFSTATEVSGTMVRNTSSSINSGIPPEVNILTMKLRCFTVAIFARRQSTIFLENFTKVISVAEA